MHWDKTSIEKVRYYNAFVKCWVKFSPKVFIFTTSMYRCYNETDYSDQALYFFYYYTNDTANKRVQHLLSMFIRYTNYYHC